MKFLTIIFCLCDLLVSSNTFKVQCEGGWTQSEYSGTCLKLSNDKKSWDDARKSCQSKGADLVKIIDSKMNAFIISFIPDSVPVFFGLKRKSENDKARWLDETEEPNYLNLKIPEIILAGTRCAVMSNKSLNAGTWDLVDCDSEQWFLCEMSVGSIDQCPSDWQHDDYENCVKVVQEKKVWEKARQHCKTLKGDLVAIYYELQNKFLENVMNSVSDMVYIGLKMIDKKDHWLDAKYKESGYLNFDPSLTETPGTLCGQLNNQAVASGMWELEDCRSEHKYICEKDKGLCPKGWIPSAASGTCIKIYGTSFKHHAEARKKCQSEGGDLVRILDENMNQFITDQVSRYRGRRFLIGLNDKNFYNHYRWLDLKEGDQLKFTNWGDGEPADPVNEYNCTEIWQEREYGFSNWVAVECDVDTRPICEKNAGCDKEKYGMFCPIECTNCKNDTVYIACNPRIGYCYFGCENPDDYCQDECPGGLYGEYCNDRCNSTCGGDSHKCVQADGMCSQGCQAGYQGSWCEKACPDHTYGLMCSQKCSPQCFNQTCDNANGSCTMGCLPGYKGPQCSRQTKMSTDETGGSGLTSILMGVAVATGITFALVLFLLTRSKNKRKEPFEDQNSGMDELQADSKSDLGLRGTSQEHMDDTGTAYSESESKLYSSRPNLEDS